MISSCTGTCHAKQSVLDGSPPSYHTLLYLAEPPFFGGRKTAHLRLGAFTLESTILIIAALLIFYLRLALSLSLSLCMCLGML